MRKVLIKDAELALRYFNSVENDPLLYVRTAFDWDELPMKEPLDWQVKVLSDIRDGILSPAQAARIAVASGHGIGKSALVAWIILWSLCKPNTRGQVTANTESQLLTKTWVELTKWYNLSVSRHIFTLSKTSLFASPEWRFDAVTWSEARPEGFAGLHNFGKRLVLIMDEGSAIPEEVYNVAEGAMTDKDTEKIFCVFGNPTQPTGRFRDYFGKDRESFSTYMIDSRTVPLTDKTQIAAWEKEYGEDSDFFRVRVRGMFPNTAANSLIGEGTVDEAMGRVLVPEIYDNAPRVLGIDVARFGTDDSVIVRRQGRKVWEPQVFKGLSTMELVGQAIRVIDDFAPQAVFIDETGVGAGVVDRLKELGYKINGVDFGSKANNTNKYANRRSEMWGEMGEWLKGADIPKDRALRQDLIAPTYTLNNRGQILLEKKENIKKRGLPSPDRADALAVTFADKVRTVQPLISGQLR